jgi:hypothetical protein
LVADAVFPFRLLIAAAPQVAGLAAYLRTINSPWKARLGDTANVKKLITLLHGKYITATSVAKMGPIDNTKTVPMIWNVRLGTTAV